MPSIKTFVTDQINRLKKQTDAAERADLARRLLPADLAEQILTECGRERGAILARMAVIDGSLTNLDLMRAKVREQQRATIEPIETPSRVKNNLDGTTTEIPAQDRGRGRVTKDALELNATIRKMAKHKRALELERQALQGDLHEIRRIEADARRGVMPALLALTDKWRSRMSLVGTLLPPVKLGASFTDAAGNPLPPTALDENGQPLTDYHSPRPGEKSPLMMGG